MLTDKANWVVMQDLQSNLRAGLNSLATSYGNDVVIKTFTVNNTGLSLDININQEPYRISANSIHCSEFSSQIWLVYSIVQRRWVTVRSSSFACGNFIKRDFDELANEIRDRLRENISKFKELEAAGKITGRWKNESITNNERDTFELDLLGFFVDF